MRNIYLPDLLSIRIQNYTLYPNGLDYNYDFVKGINLILGGNGMGKTTFVNLIKYALLGHYKKNYDFVRTYDEKAIERRRSFANNYFKNRGIKFSNNDIPTVSLQYKINDKVFLVKRDLDEIKLLSFSINGINIEGTIISEDKYDALEEDTKKSYLQYQYEKEIAKYSGITFEDMIFFVNEILFFGEDHKTILWNESNDTKSTDVQTELFNKYFNAPELDSERQESLRKAKYYDSKSRHKSEDARAIKRVIDKIQDNKNENFNIGVELNTLNEKINEIQRKIDRNQEKRSLNDRTISLLQNEINSLSLQTTDLDRQKNEVEHQLMANQWQTLHPLYRSLLKNMTLNHICPMCNRPADSLSKESEDHPTKCFLCGQELQTPKEEQDTKQYDRINQKHRELYKDIQSNQRELSKLDEENKDLDNEFRSLNIKIRELKLKLRNLEYTSTKKEDINNLSQFQIEMDRLMKDKDDNMKISLKYRQKADTISQQIEEEVTKNVNIFSNYFSLYANDFLGLKCELTYESFKNNRIKRFYPVIDGSIRFSEEELSESQRFFVDHSFRMSILSFFYKTPTFYIVETPDSSLDISYENNAANVFLKFLEKPNCVIITSNLNNSSFVEHLIANNKHIKSSVVRLLEIAKQSIVQNTSQTLIDIYNNIISKINK